MRASETNDDPAALALRALTWTLAEPMRASRLLDVTGLMPTDLRTRAADPSVLAATLGFLEAYEPDLIACAAELGVTPTAIVAAHQALEA